VETVYDAHEGVPKMLDAWVATLAFSGQIFCDFAGYSSTAIGVAMCLGFAMPDNFRFPYAAVGFSDFWRRWHITLSSWLRDYLYIPLGGNRHGPARTYTALMGTMFLGGLWHGAAWTFVLWGFYQGVLLVAHRLCRPLLDRIHPTETVDRACWKALRIFVTFHRVCLGWLIFRANSIAQVTGMLSAIVNKAAIPASAYILPVSLVILPLLIVQLVQYLSKDLDVIARTPWYVRSVFYTACFYAFVLGGEFGGSQFIYFQF
jgi:D-alanyl-lipoteichoic acid acyltransferase DltB (MBOAT superfamily)